MAEHPAHLIDLFIPLLLHVDPLVQRRSAVIIAASYGAAAGCQLRARLAQADAESRRQLRAALEVLAQYAPLNVPEAATFPGLQVNCLGVLRISVGGVPILNELVGRDRGRAGSHKIRAVLAALIHAGGRGITRAALAEAVWGDVSGAGGLARTLTSLRTLLGDAGGAEVAEAALIIGDDRCLLHPDYVRTDVDTFERIGALAAATEAEDGLAAAAELYAQALELYRGPYMADIAGTWVALLERRSLLAGDYLNMVERLVEQNFIEERYYECVRLCTLAINEDAAADDLSAWLLRAYARLGHFAELEHAYRHYLRAAQVEPTTARDLVVRTYGELRRERAVGGA
jgi:DNA-binding SARP family transcriptional activator